MEPKATSLSTLRWIAILWLAIYIPSYSWAYGWLNFLVLCNTGVLLTAIGLMIESPLLVSSQAVAAPIVCGVWGLDVATRALTGDFLFGGTAYMWDLQYPIFTRMLSLYHLAWPVVLFYAVRRRIRSQSRGKSSPFFGLPNNLHIARIWP